MKRKLPEIKRVECDEVRTGRNYRRFSRDNLGDLFISIRDHGVLQNPIVTGNTFQDSSEKPYELVAGERRFRCCELLGRGLEVLFYSSLSQDEFDAIQLAENVKKRINVGETAVNTFDFYKSLIAEKSGIPESRLAEFSPQTLPDEYKKVLPLVDFATIRGKDVSTIREYFAFAGMDKKVQSMVFKDKIDFGLAVAIAKLPEDRQLSTAVNFNGTAKQLEDQIKSEQVAPTTFMLSSEPEKVRQGTNELNSYISSAHRVLRAGLEYFGNSGKKFNGELRGIVFPALDYLYDLRENFQKKADNDGKGDRFRALVGGKKSRKQHMLDVHFDLSKNPAQDLGGKLEWLNPDLIDRDKNQPRKTFDPAALKELETSIAQIGQKQPGMVCPMGDGRYALVFGERRLRAVIANNKEREKKGLELDKYLARVVPGLTSIQRRLFQYEEDSHEQDRPDERAEAIYRWQQRAKKRGEELSSAEIIAKMGIGRTAVKKALNYATLLPAVKSLYSKNLLTYEAASELASVQKKEQRDLGFRIYLAGGTLKSSRQVLKQYFQDRNQKALFDATEVKSDFGHVFLRDLGRYLPTAALSRLRQGDIYSPSFVSGFYGLISDLEKMKKYCK